MVTLAISMETFFGGFLSLSTSFSGGINGINGFRLVIISLLYSSGVQRGVSGDGEGVFGGDHSHS